MDDEVIVYLGLGSNLGDRQANLRNALNGLTPNVVVQRTSSIYETDPWGYKEQPQFLNCVCYGLTKLQPLELFVLHLGLPHFRFGVLSWFYHSNVIEFTTFGLVLSALGALFAYMFQENTRNWQEIIKVTFFMKTSRFPNPNFCGIGLQRCRMSSKPFGGFLDNLKQI